MKHAGKEEAVDRRAYWEQVYRDKDPTQVSWYQGHPRYSFDLIGHTGIGLSDHIIDIGGGASTLVDHLLDAGYHNLSVLDISGRALQQARRRLGEQAGTVRWLECDITAYTADVPVDVWHDRAVFHFLTDVADRRSYVRCLDESVRPGGHVIIATFADDGPERCSGLDIVRYSPQRLTAELGAAYRMVESCSEKHRTPSGGEQRFIYCRFVKG